MRVQVLSIILTASVYSLASSAEDQISSGLYHNCLLRAGKVYCWGHGGQGQIGHSKFSNEAKPVEVEALREEVVQISTGAYHTCALNRQGKVHCWGYNYSGQLGRGYARPDTGFPSFSKTKSGDPKYASSSPVLIDGLPPVEKLAANYSTTCALTTDKRVFCWGDGRYMQLGDGERGFSSANATPRQVSVISSPIKDIHALYKSFCVITQNQKINCFGLSTKDFISSIKYGEDLPDTKWSSMSAGDSHACAVDSNRQLWCIGQGWYAQVMDENDLSAWKPRQTNFKVKQVAARKKTTCTLSDRGEVHCWGLCINGQCGSDYKWVDPEVGQNPALFTHASPLKIPNLPEIKSITVGATHVCALAESGKVYCWGQGLLGQIGNGKASTSLVPEVIF